MALPDKEFQELLEHIAGGAAVANVSFTPEVSGVNQTGSAPLSVRAQMGAMRSDDERAALLKQKYGEMNVGRNTPKGGSAQFVFRETSEAPWQAAQGFPAQEESFATSFPKTVARSAADYAGPIVEGVVGSVPFVGGVAGPALRASLAVPPDGVVPPEHKQQLETDIISNYLFGGGTALGGKLVGAVASKMPGIKNAAKKWGDEVIGWNAAKAKPQLAKDTASETEELFRQTGVTSPTPAMVSGSPKAAKAEAELIQRGGKAGPQLQGRQFKTVDELESFFKEQSKTTGTAGQAGERAFINYDDVQKAIEADRKTVGKKFDAAEAQKAAAEDLPNDVLNPVGRAKKQAELKAEGEAALSAAKKEYKGVKDVQRANTDPSMKQFENAAKRESLDTMPKKLLDMQSDDEARKIFVFTQKKDPEAARELRQHALSSLVDTSKRDGKFDLDSFLKTADKKDKRLKVLFSGDEAGYTKWKAGVEASRKVRDAISAGGAKEAKKGIAGVAEAASKTDPTARTAFTAADRVWGMLNDHAYAKMLADPKKNAEFLNLVKGVEKESGKGWAKDAKAVAKFAGRLGMIMGRDEVTGGVIPEDLQEVK